MSARRRYLDDPSTPSSLISRLRCHLYSSPASLRTYLSLLIHVRSSGRTAIPYGVLSHTKGPNNGGPSPRILFHLLLLLSPSYRTYLRNSNIEPHRYGRLVRCDIPAPRTAASRLCVKPRFPLQSALIRLTLKVGLHSLNTRTVAMQTMPIMRCTTSALAGMIY